MFDKAPFAPDTRGYGMSEAEFQAGLERRLSMAMGESLVWRQNAGKWFAVPMNWKTLVKRPWSFHKLMAIAKVMVGAPKGAADLTGIVAPYGWRLEVECKGVTTPIMEHQIRWARNINDMGGIGICVREKRGIPLAESVEIAFHEVMTMIEQREKAMYEAIRSRQKRSAPLTGQD